MNQQRRTSRRFPVIPGQSPVCLQVGRDQFAGEIRDVSSGGFLVDLEHDHELDGQAGCLIQSTSTDPVRVCHQRLENEHLLVGLERCDAIKNGSGATADQKPLHDVEQAGHRSRNSSHPLLVFLVIVVIAVIAIVCLPLGGLQLFNSQGQQVAEPTSIQTGASSFLPAWKSKLVSPDASVSNNRKERSDIDNRPSAKSTTDGRRTVSTGSSTVVTHRLDGLDAAGFLQFQDDATAGPLRFELTVAGNPIRFQLSEQNVRRLLQAVQLDSRKFEQFLTAVEQFVRNNYQLFVSGSSTTSPPYQLPEKLIPQ